MSHADWPPSNISALSYSMHVSSSSSSVHNEQPDSFTCLPVILPQTTKTQLISSIILGSNHCWSNSLYAVLGPIHTTGTRVFRLVEYYSTCFNGSVHTRHHVQHTVGHEQLHFSTSDDYFLWTWADPERIVYWSWACPYRSVSLLSTNAPYF